MTPMNIKPEASDAAEYDTCPCVYLNDDQVEALGIKGMPMPGTVFLLHCKAVVTYVSAEAEEPDEAAAEGNKPDITLTLKITDMDAVRSSTQSEIATSLYGA